MKGQFKKYVSILIVLQIVMALLISMLWLRVVNILHTKQNEGAYEIVLKENKEYMHEIIDNMIIRIDYKRKAIFTEAEKWIGSYSEHTEFPTAAVLERKARELSRHSRYLEIGDAVKIVVSDSVSGKTYSYENGIKKELINWNQDLLDKARYSAALTSENLSLYIYAAADDLDKIVKKYVYNEIHNSEFNENEYIWVNEILNYNGGDNYAVRVIHPNITETEGSYLNTSIQDIGGNLPYLSELEGIKKNGEVTHSYYFKNKSNNYITEKLSYAKLYKPYNWIVATGKPLGDMMEYSNNINAATKQLLVQMIILCLLVVGVILFIDFFVIYKSQKRFHSSTESYVQKETQLDGITGAFSRKAGDRIFKEHFEEFKINNISPVIMILDIDNYKYINDSFGHGTGDEILQILVQTLQKNMRKRDFIFRWGGDEFVLLFNDIENTKHKELAGNMLRCIHELDIVKHGRKVPFSISIGGSLFNKEDKDYTQSLSRADEALYYSKQRGKAQYTSYEEMKENIIKRKKMI